MVHVLNRDDDGFANINDQPPDGLYKRDYPRPIDRYIDYFGEVR